MREIATPATDTPRAAAARSLLLAARERLLIAAWVADEHPREACGLLVGCVKARRTLVVHVRRARNAAGRARDRYRLDPVDHLSAEIEARALGLAVVGVWHSHPDGPARPSGLDREGAWPNWSYVIAGVGRDGARELRSWRLAEGRFAEESILDPGSA